MTSTATPRPPSPAGSAGGALSHPNYIVTNNDAVIVNLNAAQHTIVLSGVRMPRMNAVMERWIQSCRHELLDRTLIWNQAHLLHALREYERHHNGHRPHRGISNARPLQPLPEPITNAAVLTQLQVHRHDRLGGLLHEYQDAA